MIKGWKNDPAWRSYMELKVKEARDRIYQNYLISQRQMLLEIEKKSREENMERKIADISNGNPTFGCLFGAKYEQ